MDNDETTFIYALKHPNTGDIHYVGKANNPLARYERHINGDQVNKQKTAWLAALKKQELQPGIEILEEVPAIEWPEKEQEWIAKLRAQGQPLTNVSAGGGTYKPRVKPKVVMSFRFSEEERTNLEYLQHKWHTTQTDVLARLLREAIEETKELRVISKERREEIERDF